MNNSIAIMNKNGAYIKTVIIDNILNPDITEIIPLTDNIISIIGNHDSVEYLYTLDINSNVLHKTTMEYASDYTGKYVGDSAGAIYYAGINGDKSIVVKYNIRGDIVWKREISLMSSELFDDGDFSKIVGLRCDMVGKLYVCSAYLDNYNAGSPEIDIYLSFDRYLSDGRKENIGSISLANVSSGAENELRSSFVSGDINFTLRGDIYYAVAINPLLAYNVFNGHGLKKELLFDSVEKVILNTDIDNRPILEAKGPNLNTVSKVFMGNISAGATGNFKVILGAVDTNITYIDKWVVYDTPIFKEF